MNVKVSNSNTPNWKVVTVKSHIPEALKKLDEILSLIHISEPTRLL